MRILYSQFVFLSIPLARMANILSVVREITRTMYKKKVLKHKF